MLPFSNYLFSHWTIPLMYFRQKLPTLTRKNAAMAMTRTAATVATTITGISYELSGSVKRS